MDGDGVIDEDNHDVELLQVYDLALKKELITPGPYFEGQDLDFRIRVYNQGNIVIQDLIIEDFIPEGYGYDPVQNAPFGWTNTYQTLVGGVPTTFPDTLNVMEDLFLATEDSVDIFITSIHCIICFNCPRLNWACFLRPTKSRKRFSTF